MKRRTLKKSEDIRNQISSIRVLLNQEVFLPPNRQFVDSDYEEDVKRLVMFMDTQLREQNITNTNQRRNARLKMIETIVQRKVESTYDLTKYEAGVLFKELRRNAEASGASLFKYFSESVEKPVDIRESNTKSETDE